MRNFYYSLTAAVVFALEIGSSAFGSNITLGDLTPATLPTGSSLDGYQGGVYADTSQTFGAAGIASSVTFNSGASNNNLTFMVGTFSGSQFTPSGIFNNIVVSSTGVQTVDLTALGLSSGSALVTAGETFGWVDRKIGGTDNGGSIYYGNGNGSYQFFTADSNQHENPVVGSAVGSLAVNSSPWGPRDYTVNFTIVPEPSSFILCGLGALGLFAVARRRRKASV